MIMMMMMNKLIRIIITMQTETNHTKKQQQQQYGSLVDHVFFPVFLLFFSFIFFTQKTKTV